MDKHLLICVLLMISGCSAPYADPNSICELPPGLPGWSGTTVRWKGITVGGFHHGFALAAEDCRGGIGLDWVPGAPGTVELEAALERTHLKSGLLRIEVSGKIIGADGGPPAPFSNEGRPKLLITRVHSLQFQPMSDDAYYGYWRARGL